MGILYTSSTGGADGGGGPSYYSGGGGGTPGGNNQVKVYLDSGNGGSSQTSKSKSAGLSLPSLHSPVRQEYRQVRAQFPKSQITNEK